MTETVSARGVAPHAQRRLPEGIAFVASSVSLAAFFLAAGAPTPLLPIYESDWGFAPWLLTLAFGVYAISLLLTLLVIGSLSDHIGRRPLLIASVILQLASALVFLLAPSIEWLLVARIVQGLAVGAASGAFGAAIVELAPEHRKRLGSIIVGALPTAGLAIGALFAGAVAQLLPSPTTIVWSVLVIVGVLSTLVALVTPETATPKAGALHSLIPKVAVPTHLRGRFVATIAANAAGWMTGALFLGLVPIALRTVFHLDSPLLGGAGAAVAFGSAAITAFATGRFGPHRVVLIGAGAVVLGAILFVGSIVLPAFALLWIGAAVGGAGIGATFSGSIRALIPSAYPHERAGLFAALYIVAYLALGIPAIVAGLFISTAGITGTVSVFGIAVAIVATVGIATQAVSITRSSRPTVA
jgi:MFS family permease